MVINGAALQCLAYWLYYVTLEAFAGLSWGVCVAVPIWISATLFRTHVVHAWAWALGIHVLSWYMQIHPGHMLLEGRKPALLDSFFQVRGWGGGFGRCAPEMCALGCLSSFNSVSPTVVGIGAAVCVV